MAPRTPRRSSQRRPEVSGRAPWLPFSGRLDAYFAATAPTYHTPEGDVQVPTPFRMPAGYSPHEADVVEPNDAELRIVAKSVGIAEGEVRLVKAGRGTPGMVSRLTQKLINLGKIPPSEGGESLATRIRQMMFDYGIGVDCAGYVRPAFIAAHPGASSVQWRTPRNENLSGLASRGFVRLPMSNVQVGDLIVLKPPTATEYGHTVIVHGVRVPMDADATRLKAIAQPVPEAVTTFVETITTFVGPRIRVLDLDSSWGCGGKAAIGGGERRTFYEDRMTGEWLWVDDENQAHLASSLYGHEVEGVYRLAGGQ